MSDQPQPTPDNDPQTVLDDLRQRIRAAASEYAAGNLNASQFHAIHKHYTEKRLVIEQLIARNADSSAWKAAASPGRTAFLREHLEARPLFYAIFRRGETRPLRIEGRLQKQLAQQMYRLLQVFWRTSQWRTGLARKALGRGHWLLMVVGEQSVTLVVFMMQPSSLQMQHVRDLHADFERANARQFTLEAAADRFVYPQRSLLPNNTP